VLSFAGDAEYVIRHAYLRPTKDNRMIHLNRGVFWGALLLLAVLAGGCMKQGPGPSASGASKAAPADQSAPAAAAVRSPGAPVPMPYTPAPVAAPANGDINATLNQLSLDLRSYVVTARSVPKNFEEYVAKSHAQIPPAPAGKKYIIQGQTVVLAKR
jgi:hypothetical protein